MALDADEAQLRRDYRGWADGQRRINEAYGEEMGLDATEHGAAVERAGLDAGR